MMRLLAFTGLAALAATSAIAAGSKIKDPLSHYVRTGEIVKCVPMRSTSITAIDDSHLLFKVGPGRVYLNETRSACPRASSNFTQFDFRLYGNRVCEGEILKVVATSTGQYHGACALGPFEKLERKPAPPKKPAD